MNPRMRTPILIVSLVLGGGGGDGAGNTPGSGTTYNFTPPTLNSTRTYAETITDNSNNTINVTFTDITTTINADGTYVVLYTPSEPTAVVNGTNYGGPPETETLNASGQELTTVYTNGALFNCTFDPHGSGPDFPLRVGQVWSLDYTYQCNAIAPVAITNWRDVVTSVSVKQEIAIAYSGTLPSNGYAVARKIELMSTS